MNRIEKALFAVFFAGLSYSVQAVTADNRYDAITNRNIFRLNDPPPPVAPPSKEDSTLDRKIEFSGISTVAGHKKAWFVVAPKPGSKDTPLYLSLSEGERQDFLEVVSIAPDEGEVKIMNSGNAMVLSLKNNSLKPQAVAPAPPAPGGLPVAHTAIPAPRPVPSAPSYGHSATSGHTSYGNNSYGNNSYGNNSSYSRGGVTVSGGTPVLQSMPNNGKTENTGLRTIPTRTLRLAPTQQQSPPVDPLTQRVMMEVQQEHARQTGQQLPPLPPLP